jgi:hypothetical protein
MRAVAAVKLARFLLVGWGQEPSLSTTLDLRQRIRRCAISDLPRLLLPRPRIPPLSGFTACLSVCPGRS